MMTVTPRHVAMSMAEYARLSPDERNQAWAILIQKLGVEGAYIPVPFTDESQGLVGMNIVVLGESDTPNM